MVAHADAGTRGGSGARGARGRAALGPSPGPRYDGTFAGTPPMSATAFCIEIGLREDRADVVGRRLAQQAAEIGLALRRPPATRRGCSLRVRGGRPAAQRLVEELLCDPVMDTARVRAPSDDPREPGARRVEVVRRPGVMDPAAASLERAARALDVEASDVRTWSAYLFDPDEPAGRIEQVGARLLANAVVEELRVEPTTGVPPVGALPEAPFERVTVPIRGLDDEALLAISREGCLALDAVEMRAIADHYETLGRDPTDVELETLAQTWSEHCKHKTLAGRVAYEGTRYDNLLAETIARATHALERDFCVSVFVDNAGVVAFDDEHHLTFKVETHNHPSALEPYGGAGTGLGGVLRDTMGTGLGARPVASTDVFCFGPPDLPEDERPRGCLPPRRVMKGVVAGVRDYGNRMGIPTVNGAVCFDRRYVGNPLVYCGSIGILPRDRVDKSVRPGDRIVLVGGRTGRDGIHGATFSSLELHADSESVSSGAVQIGNPIQEKVVLDAQLRARDLGLYRSVTDCGAGGLSSAVGEMGRECGAHVVLDRVPLKYHGLTYAEIWISEAQERMVLAVPPEHEAALLGVFAAQDCEATVIGTFTDGGRLVAEFAGTTVMDLDMGFLHDGLPRQERVATRRARATSDPQPVPDADLPGVLLELLAHPDVASKEWIVRQYDHEVQAGSVVKPLVGPRGTGPSDGAVVAPVLGSRRGFAVGCGIAPRIGDVDPYRMALCVIDEALRNVVAVGGDPARASILDNFSWGRCEDGDNLGDLVEACRGCHDAAMAFGTPFISGKDSLNNDFNEDGRTTSIPPTLLISALAIVEDVRRATTMDAKGADGLLVLVGATDAALGGSLLAARRGERGAVAPRVDLERAPATLRAVHALTDAGLARAVHDLSDGGLGVAAAEMAFAGGVGLRLDLEAVPTSGLVPTDRRLFAETPSRLLLEVAPGSLEAVKTTLGDVPHAVVGHGLDAPRLRITRGGTTLVDLDLATLEHASRAPLDLDGLVAGAGAGAPHGAGA